MAMKEKISCEEKIRWHYSTGNHPGPKKRGALSHISGIFSSRPPRFATTRLFCFALQEFAKDR